ncbi:EP300-interacting inhibitor of differentiation 2 [Macrotis lagotis]|uniref:EP300-interacting inhibitor of differentiation 2 n=1 Tax=Macrotis lagotis TaxID=92651 RepID=UPI003D69C934
MRRARGPSVPSPVRPHLPRAPLGRRRSEPGPRVPGRAGGPRGRPRPGRQTRTAAAASCVAPARRPPPLPRRVPVAAAAGEPIASEAEPADRRGPAGWTGSPSPLLPLPACRGAAGEAAGPRGCSSLRAVRAKAAEFCMRSKRFVF